MGTDGITAGLKGAGIVWRQSEAFAIFCRGANEKGSPGHGRLLVARGAIERKLNRLFSHANAMLPADFVCVTYEMKVR